MCAYFIKVILCNICEINEFILNIVVHLFIKIIHSYDNAICGLVLFV